MGIAHSARLLRSHRGTGCKKIPRILSCVRRQLCSFIEVIVVATTSHLPVLLYDGLISINFTKLAKAHCCNRLGRYTNMPIWRRSQRD